MIDDSELENVTGGAGNEKFPKDLPMHTCGNGETGKLVPDGWIGGKPKYKCIRCHKTGKLNYLPGTNLYCELI